MEQDHIKDGYIKVARQIESSSIWHDKPSWWLKVWMHLLLNVNHADRGKFKRAQGFFKREGIYKACNLQVEGIKGDTIDNVMRWLKSTRQITTRKTTRGLIVTVCKYERYQEGINYKNDTEKGLKNEIETTQKRHYTQECKNERNKKDLKEVLDINPKNVFKTID